MEFIAFGHGYKALNILFFFSFINQCYICEFLSFNFRFFFEDFLFNGKCRNFISHYFLWSKEKSIFEKSYSNFSTIFTWLPIQQQIIDIMHDINDIPNPEINNDFRRRCRYLVYKSSSCVFSVNKHSKKKKGNIIKNQVHNKKLFWVFSFLY